MAGLVAPFAANSYKQHRLSGSEANYLFDVTSQVPCFPVIARYSRSGTTINLANYGAVLAVRVLSFQAD
jgi:hypothetical protein